MSDLITRVISNSAPRHTRQAIEAGDESYISGVTANARRRQETAVEQMISVGANGQVRDNTLNTTNNISNTVNVGAAQSRFFFYLVIYEIAEESKTENRKHERIDPLPYQTPLRPGTIYQVRISSTLNQYKYKEELEITPSTALHMDQTGVIAGERLSLLLCEDPGESAFEAIEQPKDFDPTLEGWYCEFQLTTKKVFRKKTASLVLQHRSGSRTDYSDPTQTLTRLTVLLEETEQAGSRLEAPPLLSLPVDAEPPLNTSFLHILPEGESELKFVGWLNSSAESSRSDLSSVEFPIEELEDLGREIEYIKSANRSFEDSEEELEELICWIEKMLTSSKEDCCLVIVDQTKFQLPWELLKLYDGQYLGVQVNVVRWIEEQYHKQSVMLQLQSAECVGSVSAYIHTKERFRAEFDCLAPYYCEAISQLPFRLSGKERVKTGLVYLSHTDIVLHANTDIEAIKQFFSSFQTLEEKDLLRFNAVKNKVSQRPIFFMNSPYSGRIWYWKQKTRGLLKAALTQVASGYIGSLGPIDHELGAHIANDFLEQSSAQGISPAAFLRQLRNSKVEMFEEAVQHGDEAQIERAERQMLYSFMYVYYGSPCARLKVISQTSLPDDLPATDRTGDAT